MSKDLKNRGQNIAERRGRESIRPQDVGFWMMDASDEIDGNKDEAANNLQQTKDAINLQLLESTKDLESQIKQAELDRDNNKGIFSTKILLDAQYPPSNNKKDFFAFVGPSNPREKYIVKVDGGAWTPTGDMQNVGDVNMAEYAKKVRENGDQVVYAKGGQIILDAEHAKYNDHSVKDVLDGIGYVFGVDELPTDTNLFRPTTYVAENQRRKDGTGEVVAAVGFSLTTAIPAILPKGTILTINTNQTVVLMDGQNVVKVIDSLSEEPTQEDRKIEVDIDGVIKFAFTFGSQFPRETMHAYDDIPILLKGVPAKNVRLDSGDTVEKRMKDLDILHSGKNYGVKESVKFTESIGIVRITGELWASNQNGFVAISEPLEKNSYYFIELGEILKRAVSGSISGHQISLAGRKNTWIKTDNREDQILMLTVANKLFEPAWDIRGKYKVTKIDEPNILKSNMFSGKMPSMGADLSAFPSVSIPEPQWAIFNMYESYYNASTDETYSKPFVVEYLDSNGNYFRKMGSGAIQGKGSRVYENRNMKCKLTNQDGSKFYLKIGDWFPRSSFHFKANFVDFSQAKNQGTANFITDWYRDFSDPTKKTYPWNRGYVFNNDDINLSSFDNRARGVIASIPCLISTHWSPRHLSTMNLNGFAENFKVDPKNPLHRVYKGGGYLENNIAEWEEMCSDTEAEEMSEETIKPLRDFFDWMKDNSTSANMEVFKQGAGIRYDIDDMIDYWLLAEFIFAADSGWMNMIWLSYDSVKFTPMWWDMDTCFGSHWNGKVTHRPTENYKPLNHNITWWKALLRAYPNEIKARYHALRNSGRFSVRKINEIYGGYINRIPFEWYEMDFHTWKSNRYSTEKGNFSDLNRILWFTENRLNFLDTKYEYLSK